MLCALSLKYCISVLQLKKTYNSYPAKANKHGNTKAKD